MATLSELDVLIGQVLITGFEGLEVGADFEDRYLGCPSGGFILFGRNATSAAQVRALTGCLRDVALAHNPDYPTSLIGIDQEAGSLSPLRGIVSSLPGNMGLAATGDPEAARYAGYVTGCDLTTLGISLNFAPVLDLAREPLNPAVSTRSFGDDPDRVAVFGREYARGLVEAGVLFTVKHFPGHGVSPDDSHVSMPECLMSVEDLARQDLVPFMQAVKWPGTAVMATHVKFSAIDATRPASLSRDVITGLLRGKMGFDGVVLTDCLEMGGIRPIGSVPEAAVMAIEAGCDIALVSHTRMIQEAAFVAIRDAVQSGRLSVSRLEQSAERIRRWKEGIGALAAHGRLPGFRTGWTYELLGERVVTYLPGQADSGPIPVHPSAQPSGQPWAQARLFGHGPIVLVTPQMDRLTPAEDAADISLLKHELERRGISCSMVGCSMDPDAGEIDRAVSQIAEAGCSLDLLRGGPGEPGGPGEEMPCTRVALVVRNGGASLAQAALAAAIEARADELGWVFMLVSVRDPRETRDVQEALARRAPAFFTYSTEPVALSALSRVLAGEASPRGVMPVGL
jgi:beta-glucosidase-like glycosyl hydrolase